MLGHLPVDVDVGKDRLPAPGHGLLGELVDHHLGQLLDPVVIQLFQVRRVEKVDRIPADGPGKMALQGGGEFDHVGEEHLGMLGRLGHGQGVGQIEAEFLDVFQRLPGTIRPIDKTQVVQVQVAAQVGVRHIRGKNMEQGVLLLDPLGQGEVGGLRAVGHIGVFLVVLDQQLVHVIKRHPETGVHAPRLLQPHLQELGVDHFTDQRAGDGFHLAG
ncbi:MAG: hypothetical protein ACD_74C00038G0001, partial [uncultured bacterium]